MSKTFNCSYLIDDGYVGNRTKNFRIDIGELDPEMSDEDLATYYQESMQSDFEQKVQPLAKNESEFIQWARENMVEE